MRAWRQVEKSRAYWTRKNRWSLAERLVRRGATQDVGNYRGAEAARLSCSGYPSLMDGGSVMAPRMAIYGLKGEWEVENHGVAPDIDVEFDPHAWHTGHDPQLEKAVSVVMQDL